MNSKLKKRRKLIVKDRISGLPDEVLCHILGFLETEDVVYTSLVSKRWKNLWESVPNLEFQDFKPYEFSTFVNHFLLLRNSSNIRKLSLWVRHGLTVVDLCHFNSWIRTAVKRNVVELELFLDRMTLTPVEPPQILELPQSLWKCRTLASLKIASDLISNNSTPGCFPSLKFLHVILVDEGHDSVSKLITNCMVLEYLTIESDSEDMDPIKLEVIFNLALKTLRMIRMAGGNHCLINCPKLENLYLDQNGWSGYNLGKIELLVRASIDVFEHCSNEDSDFSGATELLAGVSNVTYLCLSAHCFQVGSLPAFQNLRQLKLVMHDRFCWDLLTELLKKSPILESLVLECKVSWCQRMKRMKKDQLVSEYTKDSEEESLEDEDRSENKEDSEQDIASEHEDDLVNEEESENKDDSQGEEGSEDEEGSEYEEGSVNEQGSEKNEEGSEHYWNPPDYVPICFMSHLKTVFFKGFTGERGEMEVAKYLLSWGEVLEKMYISLSRRLADGDEKNIYKELLMAPRGSRTSLVEFI